MDLIEEIASVINAVAVALGKPIPTSCIEIIDRGVPHIPQGFGPGKMGVYTFLYEGRFLKIGKAGPKSNNRFERQHYNPRAAGSTLAASLLADPEMRGLGITEANVSAWIKQNCRRIDVIIDASLGAFTLELVEATLHYKFEPKYEGFSSQR